MLTTGDEIVDIDSYRRSYADSKLQQLLLAVQIA